MVFVWSSMANADLIEIPDFDWPSYWEEHKDDQTVGCAHVALANALYYWDQKFPGLIPDTYGKPESQDFKAEDGKTYKLTSFWKLMSALTVDKYLGQGDVDPGKMETGIPEWFKDQKVPLSFHSTKGMKLTEEWDFLKKMTDKGEVPLIQIYVGEKPNQYLHWFTGVGYNDDKSFSAIDPNVIGNSVQLYNVTKKADGWYFTYDGNPARIQSIQAVTAIPEPSTMLLLSIAFGAVGIGKKYLK